MKYFLVLWLLFSATVCKNISELQIGLLLNAELLSELIFLKPVIGAPSDCPNGQEQDQNGNCINVDITG